MLAMVSPRRKRSAGWQRTWQVLVQHLVSMFVATIAERVVHEFDSRKVELIMSVLGLSVPASTCMKFQRSSYKHA